MGGTLTVSERILYHLHGYVRFEDKYEVPFDVTQDGISQACSISRAHAAIELKKLRSSGIIDERLSHIRKGKSRRKAYFLTHGGKSKASSVVQYVRDNEIEPMVDASRVVPITNGALRSIPSRKSSPLPSVRMFAGREKEMAAIRRASEDNDIKVISIKGIAGIGKTTVAARSASALTGQRVFWHSCKPWDVMRSLVGPLHVFFKENGCKKLTTYLSSDQVELGELSVLLDEELSDNGFTFVFDDADRAPGLQEFLAMFRHSSGAAKLMVTSEGVLKFYDQSDVVAKSEVLEMELGGLDKKSALEILDSRGIRGESAEKLVAMTKGHPLSLEMITVSGLSEARSQVARFLEERFYAGLTDSERSLLQLASVFNRPFPSDAIPKEFRGARKGSMLREVVPGRFEIHASIRDFVYESMGADERVKWHSVAADHYLRHDDPQGRLYHLIKANRRLEAEMMIARVGDSLLDSGDIQRIWEVLKGYCPLKDKYADRVQLLRAKAASAAGAYSDSLDILVSMQDHSDKSVSAEALTEMGLIKGQMGELSEASAFFLRALESSDGLPRARSLALRGLGVVEEKLGNFERAQELLEESAREAMAAVDSKGMLMAHLELGNVFIGRKMFDEAIAHFSKCAAGFGPVDLVKVLVNMGVACGHLGRLEEAKLHLENAIRLADETGQPRSRAHAHARLAEVLLRAGDPDGAREACFAALEVFTELDDAVGMSSAYANLGEAERVSGDIAAAEEYIRESVAAVERSNLPRVLGARKMALASIVTDRGDRRSSKALLEESIGLFEECDDADLIAQAERELQRIDDE